MRAFSAALGIALLLASTATTAAADGRRARARGEVDGRRHFGRHHHFHGFVHRPFFPAFLAPSVVVASPVVVAPAPVYSAPPIVYGGVPPYAYGGAPAYAPPAPPPMPRVVEFPSGRYELRGDGVYTPYSWVWIPNPPIAPPPPAPPSAPPTSLPEPAAPRAAPATTAVYRWTNEQGVTTWTDNPEKIPVRYREQASRLTP
jgi:hypothetical protein